MHKVRRWTLSINLSRQQAKMEAKKNVEAKEMVVEESPCVCNGSKGVVQCVKCGHEQFGRIARVCPVHPLKVFLMDIRCCSVRHCRSTFLYYKR